MNISFADTKLHKVFVDNNLYIKHEYDNYLAVNRRNGKNNRFKEWIFLLRVNLAYLILNRNSNKEKISNHTDKIPSLNKPESEIANRTPEIHFVQNLLQYDIISFDVFDTLVLRPFSKPTDLFMVIGNRLGIMDFAEVRIDAEKQAREEQKVKSGNTEVTIYDIYEKVNRMTGLDASVGVNTELEVELDYCFANPYMKNVWRILQNQNKRFVITSDMYLPKEMIAKILDKCGYQGYESIYVSCDYHCSKYRGGLFKNVRNDYSDKMIIHIGDNYTSDVQSAQKNGIDAHYYANCHSIGKQYRPDKMSYLIGSFYSGIVNTYLHNGHKKYDPYYEYGFIYGGLYVVGFCNWIHKQAIEKGIDKLLFIARDGCIYQKVYDMYFNDIPCQYIYWSRISNIKYSIEKQRVNFINNIARNKASSVQAVTFDDVLDSVSLGCLKEKLKEFGINGGAVITKENYKEFEDFLISNDEIIRQVYLNQERFAQQYLSDCIDGNCKVGVVDVGWKGTGPLGIKYLVEEKWKLKTTVYPFMAGSLAYEVTEAINEVQNDTISAYMFSRLDNADLCDFQRYHNKGTNCIYFELFTQAMHPSFAGWDDTGNMMFAVPEVENYKVVKKIHEGIMDFALVYKQFSDNDIYLRNISGRDAFIPFQMIVRKLDYIKKYFGDFAFARSIAGKQSDQSIETINMILEKIGV